MHVYSHGKAAETFQLLSVYLFRYSEDPVSDKRCYAMDKS